MYKRSIDRMILPDPTGVFVVAVLLLSTGAFLPLLGQEGATALQDDRVAQLVWSGVFGITCLLIVMRWKRFARVATSDKVLLLLIGTALLSVLWSVAPEVTARRGAALLGTTLFGAYLATRYDIGQLLRLLAWTLGIAAVFSLVFALALPSYGIIGASDAPGFYGEGGGWRGIYGEKNAIGQAMALGALVFLFRALSCPAYRWLAWACFGLSVGLLLMANAMTALMSFLIVLLLFPFYKALRWQYTLMLPLSILAVLAGGVAIGWLLGNMENVLSALGRDATLTGRTEIWPAVIDSIQQRPWLGYGYGGFWLGWEGESAHVWSRTLMLFWPQPIGPAHAHNPVLEVWLDLGLLGVLVFVLSLCSAFSKVVVWARATNTVEGIWPLAYFSLMLLYTSLDFPILRHHSIFWILYVAVILSISAKNPPHVDVKRTERRVVTSLGGGLPKL